MRIGVNAIFVNSRHNGTTTFLDGVLPSLISLGHEIVMYSSSERYARMKAVRMRETPRSLCVGEGASSGVQRFLWMNSRLGSKLKDDGVDVFFSPNVEGMLSCPVPQIITVHDLIPLFYPEECPRQHHYYKWALPRVLRSSVCAVAVSQHTRRDVMERYGLQPSQVTLIYNGLREQFFDPEFGGKPEGCDLPSYFLFIGTFAPRKNLETVIRAFAQIHSEVPEKLAVVAYPDRWQQSLQQLAAELGVADKIVFYSALQHTELGYLYRHATGLILLSEYEGFGFPPLEAMAMGTPAIVSDTTALAEVVGDAAIKHACRDVQQTALAMAKLSSDRNYRDRLGQAGALRARQFTWTNSGEQICAALHA